MADQSMTGDNNMSSSKDNKLQGKDFIACGIFSLMNMVAMLISSVMNISGYTAIFYPAVAAFFIAVIYVIVCCKVPKFGAILIFSIVPCIYFFTSGVIEGIIGCVGVMVFALIAEFILKKNRSEMKRITVSGLVYTLYMSVIGMAENFILTDTYCDNALAHGINAKIVEQMRSMYYIKPLWIVVIFATAVATFAGIALGKLIMRKHLKKAGIL